MFCVLQIDTLLKTQWN